MGRKFVASVLKKMKKLFKKISEKYIYSSEKIKKRGIIDYAFGWGCAGAVFGYFVLAKTSAIDVVTSEDRIAGVITGAIVGIVAGAIYSASQKNKYSKKVIDWIRNNF